MAEATANVRVSHVTFASASILRKTRTTTAQRAESFTANHAPSAAPEALLAALDEADGEPQATRGERWKVLQGRSQFIGEGFPKLTLQS